ncbi:phage-related protein/archaellum component FlaC [Croceifilum oryzae]|uniref:Phage-related protein/archaellum component FlaC n=1 Tax=Croceifilum oryzae TaxID=1553429 RepID=A0AAJ1TGJ2_9BACL|nr:hypothetical protein [Croceifilum oryzae]MDQ0418458.1 phage-related protein/archaellum component FlaC [Croceifilum oryzae]
MAKESVQIIVDGVDHASSVFAKVAREADRSFGDVVKMVDKLDRKIEQLPSPEMHTEEAVQDLQKVVRSVQQVESHVRQLQYTVDGVDHSVEIRFDAQTEKAESQVEELSRKVREASRDHFVSIHANVRKAISEVNRLGHSIREVGRRGREVGEGMVDFADNTTQGLTAPIGLISALAFKASADSSHMMAILTAKLGGVRGQIEQVAPIAKRVFRDGLGKDVEEVAIVAGHAKAKFQKLNETRLQDAVYQALALSKALGIDAVQSIDQAKEIMDKFKITSNQAFDLIAAGYTTADLSGKNLNSRLRETKGRAEEVAKAIQNSPWVQLASDWRKLQEALEPLGHVLVNLSQKYLPAVIEKVQSFSEWFSKLSDKQQLFLIGAMGILAVLPLVVMVFGSLVMVVSAVAEVFAFFASTAGLVVLGVGAIAAGLVWMYNRFEWFKQAIDGIWSATVEMFSTSASKFSSYFETIQASLARLWQASQPIIKLFGETLVTALIAILPVLNGLFSALGPLIDLIINALSAAANMISGLILLLTGDFDGAVTHFENALQDVGRVVENVCLVVVEFFSGMWEGTVAILQQFGVDLNVFFASMAQGMMDAWNDFGEGWSTFWNSITQGAMDAWNDFGEWWYSFWLFISEPIIQFFSSLWEVISPYIMPVITFIQQAWTALVTFFSILFGETLPVLFQVGWNLISSVISPIVSTIVNWIRASWSTLVGFLNSIWLSLVSVASAVWSGVSSAIRVAISPIVGWLSSIWNSTRSTASSVWSSTSSLASSIWSGTVSGIRSVVSPIVGWLSSAWNSIRSTASSVWDGVRTAIINPIQSAYERLKSIISSIVNAFASMKISIPRPRIPDIKVHTAHANIGGVSVPYPEFKLGWYAKGGLFDGASVIGVGEAGLEAVVPLSGHRMKPFADTIAKQMPERSTGQGDIIINIEQLVVREEIDITKIAKVLREEIERQETIQNRAGGMSSFGYSI